MELVLTAVLAAAVVLAALVWIRERFRWATIHESTLLDHSEAFALYAMLRDEGIRARIDTGSGAFGFGGPHQRNPMGHLMHTVRVKVHRDDLMRSHEVLGRVGR